MAKKITYILLAVLLLATGAYLNYQWMNSSDKSSTQVEASVLLERVKEVCQLVTVEGAFSEIYRETNLKEVTLYLPIPTRWNFSKNALLKVEGKVLVGYDMEQVSITIDSLNKTITLNNLPQAEILAIDHSIQYLNLEESFFNEFSAADYTQLNKNAKAILRKKAHESELLKKASEQGLELIDAIDFMAQAIGWQVVYQMPLEELPPKLLD